jgi:hypothetical protein
MVFVFSLGFFITPADSWRRPVSVMAAELIYLRHVPESGLGPWRRDQRADDADCRPACLRLLMRYARAKSMLMVKPQWRRPSTDRPGARRFRRDLPAVAAVCRHAGFVHPGALPVDAERQLVAAPLCRRWSKTRPGWPPALAVGAGSPCMSALISTALALAFSLGIWMFRPLVMPAPFHRPRADADGCPAGRLGDHALFLPDLALQDE